MLDTRIRGHGLEQFSLIKRAHEGGDHIHKQEVLSVKIAGEQSAALRGKVEEPPIKHFCEFATADRNEVNLRSLQKMIGHSFPRSPDVRTCEHNSSNAILCLPADCRTATLVGR